MIPSALQLYIITPVFNPFNFKSRYRLYAAFKIAMEKAGVKLFTVEMAFGNKPFVVTTAENPMNLQLRTNQVLWQKERLINLAAKKLFHYVPESRYIGWIDCDVDFSMPGWVEETLHRLTFLEVVQPFGSAVNLDPNEEAQWCCPSSIRAFIDGRGFHQTPPLPVSYTYKGHPGLAWTMTRSAFERMGGLYDTCIAGSADTIMSNAIKGDWSVYLPGKPSEGMIRSMKTWAEKADAVVSGKIGYTPGSVLHHWHGHSEKRGYEKRWDVLSYHQFDPAVDVTTDGSGLLQWVGNKPRLEDDIRRSLMSRNEDEI
jgi:hypothetical protein